MASVSKVNCIIDKINKQCESKKITFSVEGTSSECKVLACRESGDKKLVVEGSSNHVAKILRDEQTIESVIEHICKNGE